MGQSDVLWFGKNVELIRDLNESLIAKYIENDRSNGLERATHAQISNSVKVPGSLNGAKL